MHNTLWESTLYSVWEIHILFLYVYVSREGKLLTMCAFFVQNLSAPHIVS